MGTDRIRNFCIIAHIDHGKSTLADRLLLLTGVVSERDFREQFLDDNEIERERGITIKSRAVSLPYIWEGADYQMNLIDTPGHVDFTYEVSRSLRACEGAVLLVDASQGVQAQTVANALLAIEENLEVIPVLNKVDLPTARADEVMQEIETALGIGSEGILAISAKTGHNVDLLLPEILRRVPAPGGDPEKPLRALVFDSVYDDYRGVITYIRLLDGTLRHGDAVRFLGTGREFHVDQIGIFRPDMKPVKVLSAGEVGYLISGVKELRDIRVGDTVTHRGEDVIPVPGYREPLPVVYCGFYPTAQSDVHTLRRALDRLRLNDSAFVFEPEHSEALGFGFRCGFLGLLHMEIVQERLEREEDVDLIQTAPNVTYEVLVRKGARPSEVVRVDNPARMPDEGQIEEIREPVARVSLIIPAESVGAILQLCEERRGAYVSQTYLSPSRVSIVYDMPFSEILFDFYDKLKSATRGYGTLDYDLLGYRASDLVRLRILVGGMEVDALSHVVHRRDAERRGRRIIRTLREEIPRHLFEVPLQASIGARVVARETIRAMAKNVTAKCYGGDITRKRKLLEKQKEGKKRMKSVGSVDIPQKAFLAVLSSGEEGKGRR